MKINQQKNIKKFLNSEFGEATGNELFLIQQEKLNEIIKNINNKTKSQKKMLIKTILPRIALYKIMLNDEKIHNEAYEIMRKYMMNVIGEKKHKSMVKMEKVPGFYKIYSSIFLKIMKKTDLQKSTQSIKKGSFDVTITNCLWHNACVENDCKELCRLFCDVDNATYGNLKKIGFKRTKTLGYDGDCCDFHFYKK